MKQVDFSQHGVDMYPYFVSFFFKGVLIVLCNYFYTFISANGAMIWHIIKLKLEKHHIPMLFVKSSLV